jgi:alpha-beta hydrolase superfamily lysophospholipase
MHVSAFKLPFEGFGLHAEACWPGTRARDDERYVLFLHGGGPATSSEGTRYLREDLSARGIASVALDFTGHGRSGGRMEDASLVRRREEALRLVDGMQPPRPRAIVATSMAGHVACRLAHTVRPDALVLFCPAAYAADAEDALFGEPFRAVIRATRSFEASPAFEALRCFEGRVLCFYGSEDAVIPETVQQGYAHARACAKSFDFRTLEAADHKLHAWIAMRPALRAEVVGRIMSVLD